MNTLYATSLTGEETIYLKFTTPAQKGFFDYYSMNISVPTHSWSSDAQVRFDLIDGVDQVMASNRLGYGSESTKNLPLLPSKTYYVRIKNYWVDDASVSGYLKVKLTYTQDEVQDSMSQATEIKLSQDVVSSMDGEGDVDYFTFTTGPLENYSFSMKNIDIKTHSWSSDAMFTVQIRSSIEEILADLRASYGKEDSMDVALQPNTRYYVYAYNPWWDGQTGTYTFSVDPVTTPLDDAVITYKKTAVYTGKAITPKVTVQCAGAVLKKNVDYTVKYSKNVQPGYGKIKITGKGGYSGTKTVKFTIKPKKETIQALESPKRGKLQVTVKKDSSVAGYQVSFATDSKFSNQKTKRITTVTKTFSVKAGKKYYVRVRGYAKSGSAYIYGAWSKTKSVRIKK